MAYTDITGKKFGRYTALKYVKRNNRNVWMCRCDCGNIRFASGSDLRNGKTKSCGCYIRDWNKKVKKTHGMTNTRIYHTWIGMRRRCYDPTRSGFKLYGGRGITVCDEWNNNFESFYEWAMQNGYTDELTIDRIDVNGNYEPSICRFATNKQQMNNKTDNHFLTYNGETHTIAEWSEITGIKRETIRVRISKLHWSTDDALTKPARLRRTKN